MAHRRFTLADGMILVAATAVGFAMARAYDPGFSAPAPAGFLKRGWGTPACVITALAPALLILRARRPRARIRHVLLRPGMTACAAVVLAVVISAAIELKHSANQLHPMRESTRILFNYIWYASMYRIPWSIGGAWMTLIMMGRWRKATSWIDQAGRAVGLYWVLYPLLQATAPILSRLIPSVL